MTQSATEPVQEQQGPPPPYTVWRIQTTIYDENMNLIDEFEDTQELWLEPPNIAVRRTRKMPDGSTITYEDRGQVNERFQISGTNGFGGKWSGQVFPTGWVYTMGADGPAEFRMTNTPLGQGHQCCLRVIEVREPVAFLTPKALPPGRYYVTTDDRLTSASENVPESIKSALG